MKIENLIKNKYKNLNETEKERLRYVISNSGKIRDLKIKDLADTLYSSPNYQQIFLYRINFLVYLL